MIRRRCFNLNFVDDDVKVQNINILEAKIQKLITKNLLCLFI